MAARVEKVPGARDVLTQASDSVEYLQVKVDAQAAGRAGLAVTPCRTSCARSSKACRPGW
jgi:cobalt-zinc-cadmium resistance protein CzcA